MTLCCQGTRRNEGPPRAGPPDLTDLIGPPSATRPPGPTAAAPRSDPLRTCATIDGAGYQTLQSNIATAATLPDCGGTPTLRGMRPSSIPAFRDLWGSVCNVPADRAGDTLRFAF